VNKTLNPSLNINNQNFLYWSLRGLFLVCFEPKYKLSAQLLGAYMGISDIYKYIPYDVILYVGYGRKDRNSINFFQIYNGL
jgi:hypothetical protein